MAYDSQLWLSGTAADPRETIAGANNATRAGSAVAPNRMYIAELHLGPYTVAGTSPTLDMTIRSAATNSGTGNVIATFPQIAPISGAIAFGPPNPDSSTAVAASAVRTAAFRVDTANPYLHIGYTIGGTGVFQGCSVVLIPLDNVNN